MHLQCLKITEKVSFNITSEASYVFILSEQKFMKNAKTGLFGEFWKTEACGKLVLPERSVLIRKCKNSKISCDTFWFIFKHCGTVCLFDNVVKSRV